MPDTPNENDKTVLVKVGPEALLADVRAGRHTWLVDEPVAVGGQDAGPTPYDLLLSALGACTAITLRLYATRKKWPLEGIEVRLRHQRVHEQDCEQCEQAGHTLDEVRKELRLLGPLDEQQRQRLEAVSQKCPVQKTLMSGLRIITELVPAGTDFPA
ncbi:OsmC family protein [Hymenobacter rubripertinctus]|uniref:OsmC family peroxiredoxin n=1 Tax=Hymenobacter rubripertinctus TaxID=2029981 RepID=A0A418R336_9BACT|nr:OsmC family protein [Hymenobacter rubripertinctus]RIY11842.1 OsmC family peroxiredoxin [Hymenobacter rubripertinctus]